MGRASRDIHRLSFHQLSASHPETASNNIWNAPTGAVDSNAMSAKQLKNHACVLQQNTM